MNTLKKEFDSMSKIPMFEINVDGEFYIYYINATLEGLELGEAYNAGFKSYGLDIVEWDDNFTIDEHLQELYEIAYNDAMGAE